MSNESNNSDSSKKIVFGNESYGIPKMPTIPQVKKVDGSVTVPPMQATPTTSQNTNGNNGNNQKGK